jgi:nitroreductase
MVAKDDILVLINAASQAPSASNSQPWSFVVIQDGAYLRELSQRIKAFLLEHLEDFPYFKQYLGWLQNESLNIFYDASTLVIICAKIGQGIYPLEDCNLAAENLMLAAHAKGLGACWIGFAREFLNLPDMKQELGIADNLYAVAPIIIGYPDKELAVLNKKQPEINWVQLK